MKLGLLLTNILAREVFDGQPVAGSSEAAGLIPTPFRSFVVLAQEP